MVYRGNDSAPLIPSEEKAKLESAVATLNAEGDGVVYTLIEETGTYYIRVAP